MIVGLVLIYFVFSTLLTALVDYFFNNWWGFRSDNLESLLASAFGAEDNKVASAQKLVDEFMSNGLIVSMYRKGRPPSEIRDDIFARAYLATVGGYKSTADRPASPAEFMVRLRAGNGTPVASDNNRMRIIETLEQILPDNEQSWEGFEAGVASWFHEVGERSRGWYKRRVSKWTLGIAFALAFLVNVDTLFIFNMLSLDSRSRAELLNIANATATPDAAQNKTQPEESASATRQKRGEDASQHIALAMGLVGNQVIENPQFKAQVDKRCPSLTTNNNKRCDADIFKWYEDLHDVRMKIRCTFQYGVSPGSMATNASKDGTPTEDCKYLGKPEATPTDAFLQRLVRDLTELTRLRGDLNLVLPNGNRKEDATIHTLIKNVDSELKQASESLRDEFRDMDARLDGSGLCGGNKSKVTEQRCEELQALARSGKLGMPLGWNAGLREFQRSQYEPVWDLGSGFWISLTNLLGLALTAFALSLGAPFWFDLLKKALATRQTLARRQDEAAEARQLGGLGAATGPGAAGPSPGRGSGAAAPFQTTKNNYEAGLSSAEITAIQQKLGVTKQTGVLDSDTRTKIHEWRKINRPTETESWELDESMGRELLLGQAAPLSPGVLVSPASQVGVSDAHSPIVALSRGSSGSEVRQLKALLAAKGLLDGGQVDDDFDETTDLAVKGFQSDNGLGRDGSVGPITWLKLTTRLEQLPAGLGEPLWLAHAIHEIGVTELRGNRSNARIVEYQTTTGGQGDDEIPWCSSFVNWVMLQAGYTGTGKAVAASWNNWGESDPSQSYGAIVVLKKKGSPTPAADQPGAHVGFLVQCASGSFHVLGGNQGGSVCISRFPMTAYEAIAFRRPPMETSATPPATEELADGAQFPFFFDKPERPRLEFGSADREAVRVLQQQLNSVIKLMAAVNTAAIVRRAKIPLVVDGVFGDNTQIVLECFQAAKHLSSPLGVVDEATWASLDSVASAGVSGAPAGGGGTPAIGPLTLVNIDTAIGSSYPGLTTAHVRAVIEVESNGRGFLGDGRPRILFEGHVLWRELVSNGVDIEAIREASVKNPSILYAKWTTKHYTRDAGEWKRLEDARALCASFAPVSVVRGLTRPEQIADLAASWGLFQIMGFNWERCGCRDLAAFIAAIETGEVRHLELFLAYLNQQHLVQKLIDRDWAGFAEKYNGSGYRANQYDLKLKKAYDRYA